MKEQEWDQKDYFQGGDRHGAAEQCQSVASPSVKVFGRRQPQQAGMCLISIPPLTHLFQYCSQTPTSSSFG